MRIPSPLLGSAKGQGEMIDLEDMTATEVPGGLEYIPDGLDKSAKLSAQDVLANTPTRSERQNHKCPDQGRTNQAP